MDCLRPAHSMKAVILAAGCATRLRPHSDDTPKTLLPVGGVPILRRTITSLLRCGIDQFVIGTGYYEHMVCYDEAAFQQTIDEGTTLYGVDIGTKYASEIDTIEDLMLANARRAQRPAFDVRIAAVRLAV